MLSSRTLLALTLAIAAIPLASGAEEFVTAKGEVVQMPEIGVMTCEQIEVTLARIDSTRYRENAPVPHDRADDPLHQYEENLAKALFRVCVVESHIHANSDAPAPQQSGKQ